MKNQLVKDKILASTDTLSSTNVLDTLIRTSAVYAKGKEPKGHPRGYKFVDRCSACQRLAESALETAMARLKERNAPKPSRAVASAVYDMGVEKNPALATRLGEVVAPVNVRFTPGPFDWRAGQYGDGGSCFWEAHREAVRDWMAARGFWAAQFSRDPEFKGDGIGRSWIYPTDEVLIVFNAYGIPLADQGEAIRKALGVSRSVPQHLYMAGHEHGPLYINNGHCRIVGEEQQVQEFLRKHGERGLDLDEWVQYPKCPHCHGPVDPDEAGGFCQFDAKKDTCYCSASSEGSDYMDERQDELDDEYGDD